MMEKFKNSIAGSTIILTVLCVIVGLSLSFAHKITDPIIKAAGSTLTIEQKMQLLPGADEFEFVDMDEDVEGVNRVEKALNNSGYIVETVVTGYHGEFKTAVGIDSDGNIAGIIIMQQEETKGVGTKVFEPENIAKYIGLPNPEEVDIIAGSTVTNKAFNTAINQAIEAYNAIGGEA